MYIPDLFGAYVKGRELAIAKNWDDLKNFESVEAQRNQNDLTAMDIWERRQQMPGKMSMFYDNVNNSSRANEVAEAGQRGMLARANMGSDVAVGDYAIYKQHEQDYLNTKSGMFGARVGQQANAVQNLLGQNEYLAPIARELGQITARTGANQVRANGVLGDNLVNAAQQGVTLSNQAFANNYKGGQLQGKQLDSAIIQQPLVHDNTMYDLRNYIPTKEADSEQIAKGRAEGASLSEIANLISLAQEQGPNGGAAWHLRQLGYDILGNPLTGGQTATPAQATQGTTSNSGATGPAATQTGYPQGMTPNGMPVDLFNQVGNTVGGGSSNTASTNPTYFTPTVNSSDAARVGAKVLGIGSKQKALVNADFAGMIQPIVDWDRKAGAYYANHIAHYNPLDIRYWQALGNNLFPNGIIEQR